MERYRDRELSCIFGTLASDDIPDARMLEGLVKTDIVVTMSPGGPVKTWLEVGRLLMAARPLMIIDRICASSCANYISPIADQILAVEGSLMIWHGGPAPILAVAEDQADRDLQAAVQAFIDSTTISDTIFPYSSQPASENVVGVIQEQSGDAISYIDGYALSPERLRRCFGYTSVDRLWHPGGNREVYLAGIGLNRSFVVLENPGFDCEQEQDVPRKFPRHDAESAQPEGADDIRKSGSTEARIIGMIQDQEAGLPTAELCREHGLSPATFYKLKAKYGGMDLSDAKWMKQLEDENAKLQRLLAEAMLVNVILKDLLGKP